MTCEFEPVAEGVFVCRHERLRLNVGLVVGEHRCLVIDTGETATQARHLRAEVRKVTPLPWVVVNTHGHHDHCFGNAEFLPAEIWGHHGCATMLTRYGDLQRQLVRRDALEAGDHALADELSDVAIVAPDHTLVHEVAVDLGGRSVMLRYLGRGHTDNDLVVDVPDAVVFAGDLIEEGDPAAFEDAFPLDWPATVGGLTALLDGRPAVPGHGAVVDTDFVADQRTLLQAVADTARAGFADGRTTEAAAEPLDLPAAAGSAAMERAYRQLRSEPPYADPAELRGALGLDRPARATE